MFEININFKHAETKDFSVIELDGKFFVLVKHGKKTKKTADTAFAVLMDKTSYSRYDNIPYHTSKLEFSETLTVEFINFRLLKFNERVGRKRKKNTISTIPDLTWTECVHTIVIEPFRRFDRF